MERREFFAGALGLVGAQQMAAKTPAASSEIFIERAAKGQPHKGKVLALITAHLDDGPSMGCGTVVKLLKEGYTGYFIRTSNDEKDSYDLTMGETIAANERDADQFIKACGLKQWFNLGYRNHRLDEFAVTEMRVRLIFLFRLLKVDTVITFDPWGHYEENPDHYVTARAVEAACWMSGGHLDMPEHFAAGLKPHVVRERYYFARGPQLVNRVVDIAPTLQTKIGCLKACRTMVNHTVKDIMEEHVERDLQLPAFPANETAAIDKYAKLTVERKARSVGKKYGLRYAEAFHYIGRDWFVEKDVLSHPKQL